MSADDFEMFIQIIELLTDYMLDENRIVSFLLVILIVDANTAITVIVVVARGQRGSSGNSSR